MYNGRLLYQCDAGSRFDILSPKGEDSNAGQRAGPTFPVARSRLPELRVRRIRPGSVRDRGRGADAAGLAVGDRDTVELFRSNWRVDREFEPELRASEAEELHRRWGEAVEWSLDRA